MKDKIKEICNKLNREQLSVHGATEELLSLFSASDCEFEIYAEFCIECDRKGMKPLKYKDYLTI